MSLAREFELEDELEFPPRLTSGQLVEYKSFPTGNFMARLSGFDPGSTTSGDGAVVRLHSAAVERVVREVMAKATDWCVELIVEGHEDPQNDPKPHGRISRERARVIAGRIWARLPATARRRVSVSPSGARADFPLGPSTTHQQRALNRRVEVTMMLILCA